MKIRTGFVSNSSSSSFIVAFDKKPKSAAELKTLLFGKKKTFENPYSDPKVFKGAVVGWPAITVARTVWDDLKTQEPLTEGEVYVEFTTGYLNGDPAYDWRASPKDPKKQEAYDKKYNKAHDAYRRKRAALFLANNKGKVFFRFQYSDNDGSYHCALEHGNLFERLTHICFSQH
jgi:hypothetical protein